WWEMSAGTMLQLAASKSAIDTSDQLMMFEGEQKVFVVNGSNLKVADFINTKLNHAELTTAHAKGDILTQATSTATMIVDFTNTAKTATYGYATSGTWNAANSVTGSGSGTAFTPTLGINGMLTHTALTTAHTAADILTQATSNATMTVEYTDTAKTHTWGRITGGTFTTTYQVTGSGSGTAFTPTATNTRPPLWYDWTVYVGGASGTMPTKTYLGCFYRKRCVLAGDPNYPYRWYMARVSNPWNWLYVTNDPLSAIRGLDSGTPETADIIRALIPYRDDYLILGCANSIRVIRGDPCAGGSQDVVDSTVGIFGAQSWCFDGNGNLFFWGTNGIYKLPVGFGQIECLTELCLPKLVDDEQIDPSVYRITMGYDRKRGGILISITKVADGTNSCYWYDLKLGAFYPESYPDECGAYSQFYYDANDDAYRDLLVGCKDGYIRKFDNTQRNDDIGGSDEAISSYCTIIQQISENADTEAKLTSLTAIIAGGASGGTFTDTTDSTSILNVTYGIYKGNNAELVLEDIRDGADAHATGTWTTPGKQNKVRARTRGVWLGIKLSNSTASKTWAIEKLFGEIQPAGKSR
ncbi:MAG: hypothetical protein MUP81_03410, partial [Dehalococcoidia bacterium]|nr:hypothetical protein [Dehalococcoidia bacterium]